MWLGARKIFNHEGHEGFTKDCGGLAGFCGNSALRNFGALKVKIFEHEVHEGLGRAEAPMAELGP